MDAFSAKNEQDVGGFAAGLFARQMGADLSIMIGGMGVDEVDWLTC